MKRILFREILCGLLALAFMVLIAPKAKAAPPPDPCAAVKTWSVNLGAQSADAG